MASQQKLSSVKLALILASVALFMLGVAYAFVPLYRLFCQVFGIPVPSIMVGEGPTILSSKQDSLMPDRYVTIRFMANQAQGSPVLLTPTTRSVRLKIGEPYLTAYKAQNRDTEAFHGTAVHTIFAMGGVDGSDVSSHVALQQCFCFEEQTYPPITVNDGKVNLPLSFTISSDLPEKIHTITFAYTLFEKVEGI